MFGWLTGKGRTIPGNTRRVSGLANPPDRQSVSLAASMAIATAPFSPMARGVEPNGRSGFMAGDRGYGTNRFAGRTPPRQDFAGAAIVPVAAPSSFALGVGAGVAGQPGWPSTGSSAGGPSLSMPSFYGFGG